MTLAPDGAAAASPVASGVAIVGVVVMVVALLNDGAVARRLSVEADRLAWSGDPLRLPAAPLRGPRAKAALSRSGARLAYLAGAGADLTAPASSSVTTISAP